MAVPSEFCSGFGPFSPSRRSSPPSRVAASFAPAVLQRRTTQGLINLIAVVGLYVFVGNSGVLSFGNVAFMAIGAYVSALLTMKPTAKSVFLPDLPAVIAHAEWPTLPGALAGGIAAALVALVIGWPLMRLSGISASIATFAILVVANVVFGNWTSVTGGQNSLMGLPAYVDLWTALAWAVAAIVIAFAYQETRSALLLRASREDEAAAQAAGVDVVRHRLIAFVISAFLSGVAGVLLGHFLGIVRVENFYLDLTFLIVAMLVIGGRGSLTGAVAGAVVIAALTEVLRRDRGRFSGRQNDHRRAGGDWRRHPRPDHAAHYPPSPGRHRRGAGVHLAVRPDLT